jgi:hypothetical protein
MNQIILLTRHALQPATPENRRSGFIPDMSGVKPDLQDSRSPLRAQRDTLRPYMGQMPDFRFPLPDWGCRFARNTISYPPERAGDVALHLQSLTRRNRP